MLPYNSPLVCTRAPTVIIYRFVRSVRNEAGERGSGDGGDIEESNEMKPTDTIQFKIDQRIALMRTISMAIIERLLLPISDYADYILKT